MNKKLVMGLVASGVVILAGVAGFLWFDQRQVPTPAETAQTVTEMQGTTEAVNQRIFDEMPSENDATTASAPESIPDVNPYRNTNPFSDVKTNPFE